MNFKGLILSSFHRPLHIFIVAIVLGLSLLHPMASLAAGLAASIASTQLRLSVEDSLRGITINAAKAVNRERVKGSLEVGKDGDFVIMDASSYIYPIYHFGHNQAEKVFVKGEEFVF